MSGKAGERALERLLRVLVRTPSARLVRRAGAYALAGGSGREKAVEAGLVRVALADGLLAEDGAGGLRAADAAGAWLERRGAPEPAFLAQHTALGRAAGPGAPAGAPLIDLEESPVAQLARRRGRDGRPLLDLVAVAAAERLRRDFERGQLQPRVTANWSASVNRGRRSGYAGGIADLTEAALAARRRVAGAVEAVGPELAGVMLDVCCFLKGLETVERERGWPARSAKLALSLALAALARHYGYSSAAHGPDRGRLRHWGSDDYRPEIE